MAFGAAPQVHAAPAGRGRLDLSKIPNFCAHEHWGSINSIGMVGEGFRADVEQGAVPHRRTGLCDILFDPYIGMLLGGTGASVEELAKRAGAKSFQELAGRSVVEALKVARPALRPFRMNGIYQCIRRGLLALHGLDLESPDDAVIKELDAAVARRYEDIFGWYVKAMEQAHFSELIRPVHPEFFVRRQSPETAAAEARFTRTILRVDPLLGLWTKHSPRRDALAKIVGVEPADAKSWRKFLDGLFDLADRSKTTGIKQLQAYSRSLDFRPVADGEVKWRGDLRPAEVIAFQDWVMHECCRRANDRRWPHQVHVGTHNIGRSSPLPLAGLAERYPRMKIVQIHCWPFLKEAGWLAGQYRNIYIDTNALPLFGPGYLREALSGWLNYVPLTKIMCAHDGTSVEMAVGSSLFTREILAEVLQANSRHFGLSESALCGIAADLLQNNAVAVYGVGKTV